MGFDPASLHDVSRSSPGLWLGTALGLTCLSGCLVVDLGAVGDQPPTPEALMDVDGDGASFARDCDDSDASRSPDLAERCGDSSDNDCDLAVDEACGCGPDALLGVLEASDALGQVSARFDVDAPPHFEARLKNICNNTIVVEGAEPCFVQLSVGQAEGEVVSAFPGSCGQGDGLWSLAPGQFLALSWPWDGRGDDGEPAAQGDWQVEAHWITGANTALEFELVGGAPTPTPTQAQPTPTQAQPTPTQAQPTPTSSMTPPTATATPVTPTEPPATPTEIDDDTDSDHDTPTPDDDSTVDESHH